MKNRSPVWLSVSDEDWSSWRWQLKNRLSSVAQLGEVIKLTESEIFALSRNDLFRVDITPYFASLIDSESPECPIRKQVIPTHEELIPFEAQMKDSLAEEKHSPVPSLVHRYPDRVLFLLTTQCASYCRYCTRSRIVGDPSANFNRREFDAAIAYVRANCQIRDVLLSGGDPLVLAPKVLEYILSELRAIKHVEIIRIGSRVPIFLPMKINQELCDLLARFHPLWLNIHVNHPKEITPEVSKACDMLSRSGIPLGNQSVLLAGINDSVEVMRALSHKLVINRVRPYYLYQCDLVQGAGHFRTSVSKGIEIVEGLRGHTSGYSIPTYVVDGPGGGGKIPLAPQYLLSQSPGKVVLRNYEGFITTYSEPLDYKPADQSERASPSQGGIADLLAGNRMTIEPKEFE